MNPDMNSGHFLVRYHANKRRHEGEDGQEPSPKKKRVNHNLVGRMALDELATKVDVWWSDYLLESGLSLDDGHPLRKIMMTMESEIFNKIKTARKKLVDLYKVKRIEGLWEAEFDKDGRLIKYPQYHVEYQGGSLPKEWIDSRLVDDDDPVVAEFYKRTGTIHWTDGE